MATEQTAARRDPRRERRTGVRDAAAGAAGAPDAPDAGSTTPAPRGA